MLSEKVTILGMGYVGLTLAVALAEKGFLVTGVDTNKELVSGLNQAKPHFFERDLGRLLREHLDENLAILTTMPKEPQQAYIVSVGTPIDHEKKPVLTYLENSVEQLAGNLHSNPLVVIRSTVPVGTTRRVCKPILDRFKNGGYHLAYCPERTAEGDAINELKFLPQIISGIDEESAEKAAHLFSRLTSTIVRVSSLETAELIKLYCNEYRDIHFSIGNELARGARALGLDPLEVIRSCNMGYPRSNIAIPGPVGGACLSKDPYIIISSLEKAGYDPKLLRYTRELNEQQPRIIVKNVHARLEQLGVGKNAKLFLTGIAFKGDPETNDTRGSPSLDFLAALKEHGYTNVYGHDFVVSQKEIEELGAPYLSLQEGFRDASCVIVANNNRKYQNLEIENLLATMKKPALLTDVWGMFNRKYVEKRSVAYEGF